jgi:phosphoribosyl-dephospho-CoA transferase
VSFERHWLASVHPHHVEDLVEKVAAPSTHDAVAHWLRSGWPLSVTRQDEGCEGIFLGMPLPPAAGKRRIRFSVRRESIAAFEPPLPLTHVASRGSKPVREWLDDIDREAHRRGILLRVFGSYAWSCLTDWDFTTPASDLDLVCDVTVREDVAGCIDLFRAGHPKCDVELRFPSGRAVALGEWMAVAGKGRVLAKSLRGPSMVEADELAAELCDR